VCLRRTIVSAAEQIGIALQDEITFARFKSEEPVRFARILKRHKVSSKYFKRRALTGGARWHGVDVEMLTKKQRISVGLASIELLRQSTIGMTSSTEGLICISSMYSQRGRKQMLLSPTKATEEWLRTAHGKHEVLLPFYLPTVAVPLDHNSMRGGGYHTNEILRKPLVKATRKSHLEELGQTEMPIFYDAVNALQRTKWSVNQDVLRVVSHLWEEGVEVANLPPRNDLPKPADLPGMKDDKSILKQWKRLAAATMKRNLTLKGKRVQVARLLYMAEKFQAIPFFYPYSADFRGRLYTLPYFMQPMGDSKGRGLLQFWDAKPIETQEQANALALSGAGHFGVDKCSYEDRLQWVAENEENIRAVYNDPLDCMWWSEEGDSCWEALAWCMDYGAFLEEGFGYESRLPVHVDGVNNGLQCYALALRHTPTAQSVSVSPCEAPSDIYQRVADKVTKELEASDHPFARMWLQFVNGRVPREAAKVPTMTLCYGSTQYSCQSSITAWYDERRLEGQPTTFSFESYDHCTFLSRMMWAAINDTVQAARTAMRWIHSVAEVCSSHEIDMRWNSPHVGFPVRQHYTKWATKRITTSVGQVVRRHVFREDREGINSRRVRQAAPANLVHSWDAAAMQTTVSRAHDEGLRHFSCIHDSYGVHAADLSKLNRILREAWIDCFAGNPLLNFKREIEALLPAGVRLEDPPEQGDFDLESLRDSKYFFH